MMTATSASIRQPEDFFHAHEGKLEFVDIPEFRYLVVDGQSQPGSEEFQAAIKSLYSASYTAHFMLKHAGVTPHRVEPLEALWVLPAADGGWSWRAMIAQGEPVDENTLQGAIAKVEAEHPELPRARCLTWAEGLCAQTMYVGPYDAEGPAIERFHAAITAAGYELDGTHHEIYLGDPRRSKPEKLRTLIRQPVKLARRPG